MGRMHVDWTFPSLSRAALRTPLDPVVLPDCATLLMSTQSDRLPWHARAGTYLVRVAFCALRTVVRDDEKDGESTWRHPKRTARRRSITSVPGACTVIERKQPWARVVEKERRQVPNCKTWPVPPDVPKPHAATCGGIDGALSRSSHPRRHTTGPLARVARGPHTGKGSTH